IIAQVNSALPGTPGSKCLANYDFSKFDIAPDGSFEVIVSAQKHEGNWIQLDPEGDYQWLMFRPLLENWEAVPPLLTIERTTPLSGTEREIDEYGQENVAKRIVQAARFIRFVMEDW